MADNKAVKSDASATLFTAGTKEVTFSGDTIDIQLVELVAVGGAEGSRTITEISSETNGLLVNLGANNDVAATLAAETTKVIGTVNVAAGQTIAATGPLTNAELRAADIPVSGVVGATQSGSWTVTANAGTGTLATSLASVPSHDVTNAGTFATQITGSGLTALQLIDDPIATIGTTPLQRVAIFDAADTQITSFGGGTQYIEGATDATITGTAMMMEVGADTLQPVQGTVADGLLVNLGANNDVTATLAAETTKIIGTVNIAAAQTIAATGPLTNAELRAADVPVSGVITANLGTIADVATQTTLSSLDSKVTACNTGAVVISSGSTTVTQTTASNLNAQVVGNVASAATDSGNPVKIGGIFNTTQPTVTTGQRVNLQTDSRGGLIVANGVNAFTVQPGNTANTTPWLTAPATRTTGGLTTYHLVSAATTNLTNIKASAGQLYGWYIYNSNASARKLCFHNTAGTPTAGASIFFSLVIPPTAGANVFLPHGIAFSTGIGISTVTGLADNDTAAVALNDLIINLWYA